MEVVLLALFRPPQHCMHFPAAGKTRAHPRSGRQQGFHHRPTSAASVIIKKPFFPKMKSARKSLHSYLRVSPIRVCGLGGVRFALNGRAPFHFPPVFSNLHPARF